MQFTDHRPTMAIVDLAAIRHNVQHVLETLSADQKLYATVKANAYGHGSVPVSKAALEAGATGLLVATVDEAIELREANITSVPIIVLGLTDPRGIAEILHYQITVTVAHPSWFDQAYRQLEQTDQLDLLKRHRLICHLPLDTGMGRIGLRTHEEIEMFHQAVSQSDWVDWQGVFTHFSTAGGGPADYIEHQLNQWNSLLESVPSSVKERHFANTAMGIWHNDSAWLAAHQTQKSDIIRFGIGMYGIDPKDQLDSGTQYTLQPALELVSELVYVKQVPAGQSISYGATYTTESDEWIGTIPIGYADGWLRHYREVTLSVKGQPCPVLGVINMDQLMIRLPENYPVGTSVILISPETQSNNSASNIAKQVGTIGYEIVTSIGERVPRVYLNE